MSTSEQHNPVLKTEVITGLDIRPNGKYIDATFGRGGHAQAILNHLNQDGQLLVIDQDLDAISIANKLAATANNIIVKHANFSELFSICSELNWLGQVDGILIDCGVSSPQLDNAARGFSFMRDGPLDMRMDNSCGQSAAQWIACVKQQDLSDALFKYGDERYARKIAAAIVAARNANAITTTLQLAEIIKQAHPKWPKDHHPATRSFQAIRIFINRELEQLESALDKAPAILKAGGRLCAISFHSLEDRIIKSFAKKHSTTQLPPGLPIKAADYPEHVFKIVCKAITANADEIKTNPRARSAKLHIMERTTSKENQ